MGSAEKARQKIYKTDYNPPGLEKKGEAKEPVAGSVAHWVPNLTSESCTLFMANFIFKVNMVWRILQANLIAAQFIMLTDRSNLCKL